MLVLAVLILLILKAGGMSTAAIEGTNPPPLDPDSDYLETDLSLGFVSEYDLQIGRAEKLFGVSIGRPGKSYFYKLIVQLLIRPLGFLYSLRHPVRVEGEEYFPRQGPVVTVGNHESLLDPFLVVYKLRFRPFTAINKLDNFQSWYAFIIRGMGQIPFVRKNGTKAQRRCTMDLAAVVLKEGGVISIYPESHRCPGLIAMWHPLTISEIHKRVPEAPFISISIHYATSGLRRPVTIKIGPPQIHTEPPSRQTSRDITAFHRNQVVAMSGLPDNPDFDASKHIKVTS